MKKVTIGQGISEDILYIGTPINYVPMILLPRDQGVMTLLVTLPNQL